MPVVVTLVVVPIQYSLTPKAAQIRGFDWGHGDLKMMTLGIDLAAQPRDTAACEVHWTDTYAETVRWHCPLNNTETRELMTKADKVGIDVPLGWPTGFVRAVYRHQSRRPWPKVSMRQFRLRATDCFVHEIAGICPLSVSTDRIGIPAARAALILSDFARPLDRTGDGKIVEVYPAAALRMWGFPCRGYKGRKGAVVRCDLVQEWNRQTAAWGRWTEKVLAAASANDNVFDALIAATVARCAALGRVVPIPSRMKRRAKLEGWIAVPAKDSLANLFPRIR